MPSSNTKATWASEPTAMQDGNGLFEPSEKTKIAVVIPAYSEPIEKLDRCLKSVFDQPIVGLRAYVMLTGTENASLSAHLKRISAEDPRIRFFHQEQRLRASEARNALLEKILQDDISCIAFLDADDEWLPGHLNQFRQRKAKSSSQMQIYSSAYKLRSSGQKVSPKGQNPSLASLRRQPLLLSSTIIQSYDGSLSFQTGVAEDLAFFADAIRQQVPFSFGPKATVIYDQDHWRSKSMRFKILRTYRTFKAIHRSTPAALFGLLSFSTHYMIRRARSYLHPQRPH